jgi:ferrous iron transport protein B
MAWLFKRTLLRGEPPLMIMELPPYKRPVLRVTLRHMWDRSKIFLRRAGTVILGLSIVLWFLATYPKDSAAEQASPNAAPNSLNNSRPAPRANTRCADSVPISPPSSSTRSGGRRPPAPLQLRRPARTCLIEPLIRPLGFDWKIGIGIVASFAAREVFVSTMSTVYNVGEADDNAPQTLAQTLREQRAP